MTSYTLTIDTNILEKYKYDFDFGILDKLKQFKNNDPVKLVFSEIVISEAKKHLTSQIKTRLEGNRKSINNLRKSNILTEVELTDIFKRIESENNPKDLASKKIDKFLSDTGAEVIKIGALPTSELTELYFQAAPPFEKAGIKKSEFPDAIALLTLEKWAKSSGKTILAASGDKGWSDFAVNTDEIIVVDDLSKALDLISNAEKYIEEIITNTLKLLDNKSSGEYEMIRNTLDQDVPDIEVNIEAYSDFYYEQDLPSIEFKDFAPKTYEFETIEINGNEITIQVDIAITVEVTCGFDLYVTDPIDKDQVLISSQVDSREDTISATILIMMDVDHLKQESEITDVQLLTKSVDYDFGTVEPDF